MFCVADVNVYMRRDQKRESRMLLEGAETHGRKDPWMTGKITGKFIDFANCSL